MDDDQQFCLRWNNHQSTLVAVFDTLLENNTLVDCTLAAEGKYLNAHKVVLSACSPYFESLLSKHFDKHPIVVLKDVKFQELKAMMDYMYRGEVNISQDQLGALLKAAESLQIKGLSDNKRGETERKPVLAAPVAPKSPPPAQSTLPKVQGLTIEQRNREDSREGSTSPGPRKKKRMRRKSEELDNHDASNSSESHSLPAAQTSALPAKMMMTTAADVPEPLENKSDILTRHKQQQQTDEMPQVPMIKEKLETHTEVILEPKSEYVDEMNEDSIEDLTLDDDDLSNMEQMDDQAGPSHGNAGEGSSQGFGGWHMGNQSQDEVFLAAQEAVGAHRDSQEFHHELLRNQKKILSSLDYMKKLLQESFGTTEFFGENDLPATLPLQCVEDLEELEGKLKDATLFEKMVSILKLIGGRNGPDTTRRIMSRIICHRLAIKLNWSGRNEKPALKLFPHVVKLITDCVRKNPINKDFSTKQIEDQIKMWLRGAMDREGGRSERYKKNNVSISQNMIIQRKS